MAEVGMRREYIAITTPSNPNPSMRAQHPLFPHPYCTLTGAKTYGFSSRRSSTSHQHLLSVLPIQRVPTDCCRYSPLWRRQRVNERPPLSSILLLLVSFLLLGSLVLHAVTTSRCLCNSHVLRSPYITAKDCHVRVSHGFKCAVASSLSSVRYIVGV